MSLIVCSPNADTSNMPASSSHEAFYARCLRVAAAANAAGATFKKSERGRPTLEVSGNGQRVEFPIVTDDRAWKMTSPEEAFYSVLVDAREWSGANLDPSVVATITDEVEIAELPLIRKDLSEEMARIDVLAHILGGREKLEELWSVESLASA